MKSLAPVLVALACLSAAGCKQSTQEKTTTTTTGTTAAIDPAAGAPAPGGAATEGQERTLPGGLKVIDVKVGSGPMAERGNTVAVHYTGWLTDGTKFDSSLDRGEPIVFPLGSGRVIRGWEEGVKGMRVGGKRKLTIPPEMGYGQQGYPPVIPPGATLVFDVELMDVK